MSQLILSRGNAYKKGLLNKLFPNLELGPYFLIISLIVFVALITIITLMFSTRQVTKGYVLHELEDHHATLVKENEVMDMEISKVRALNYIEGSAKVASMRNPNEIVFVDGDSVVASK